jgi:hypothetical protein
MATDSEHQRQARHNREFLDGIDSKKFPDWVAVVAFYTAVHLVQALFSLSGDRCRSHRQRNELLRQKFPAIWKHYHPLYSFSRLARYWCMKVVPDQVPYVVRRLGRLEREIEAEAEAYRKRGTP